MTDHICTSFTDWESEHLQHFGIKGMKWGIRRYQNKDGTLTEAGKARYTEKNGMLNTKGLSRLGPKRTRAYAEAMFKSATEEAVKEITRVENMPRRTKAEIAAKTLAEEKLLSSWNKPFEDMTWYDNAVSNELFNRTIMRSGDRYSGTSVTPGNRKAQDAINSAEKHLKNVERSYKTKHPRPTYPNSDSDEDRSQYYEDLRKWHDDLHASDEYKAGKSRLRKVKNALCGQVLRDIGFEDTPTARESIYNMVFYD